MEKLSQHSKEINSRDAFLELQRVIDETGGFVGSSALYRHPDGSVSFYLRGELSADPGALGPSMANVVGAVFSDPTKQGNLILRPNEVDAWLADLDDDTTTPVTYTPEDLAALLGRMSTGIRTDIHNPMVA